MKVKLVSNWRKGLRMMSVQLSLLGGTISTTYASMYDRLKDTVSPSTMAVITGVVFALSILARFIDQGLDAMEDEDAPQP